MTFDPRTCTLHGSDYVELFAHPSFTEDPTNAKYLIAKYSGWLEANWPGTNGYPALVLPSDHVTVHFHSRVGGSGRLFGYALDATAPVCRTRAHMLFQRVNEAAETGVEALAALTPQRRKFLVHAALAECANNEGAAQVQLMDWVFSTTADATPTPRVLTGVFATPTGLQVNALSAEVFTDGHMLMPVPASVSDMGAFRSVFPGRARNCTPVAVAASRRVYEIEDRRRGFVFTLQHWNGLGTKEVRPPIATAHTSTSPVRGDAIDSNGSQGNSEAAGLFDSGSDSDGVIDSHVAVAREHCFGMPVETSDGAVTYRGVRCDVKVVDGVDAGWVSEILGMDVRLARSEVWLSQALFAASQSGGGSDEYDPRSPVLYGLMWYTSDVDPHGAWYVLEALPARKVLHAFQLVEVGRCTRRVQVFSSDARFCLAPLNPRLMDKLDYLSHVCQYQTKNIMASHGAGLAPGAASLIVSRSPLRAAVADEMVPVNAGGDAEPPEAALETPNMGGVVAPSAVAGGETMVEAKFLTGIVPAALLDLFQFWKREDPLTNTTVITGHRVLGTDSATPSAAAADGRVLEIRVVGDAFSLGGAVHATGAGIGAGAGAQLHTSSAGDDRATVVVRSVDEVSHRRPLVLVDVMRAPPRSLLGRIADWVTRLDCLSHVLVWSFSDARPGEELEVNLIEFPRLGLSFKAAAGSAGGDPRFECVEHSGTWVSDLRSDAVNAHFAGLPHGVLLQDASNAQHLLVSNVPMHRPDVRAEPFSTFVVPAPFAGWGRNIKTRHYVYPLHPTEAFFTTPSLAAALYLVYLKIMARDYVGVTPLIPACSTDVAYDKEATFVLSELVISSKEDRDPAASAVRLKLFSAYVDSFGGDVSVFKPPDASHKYMSSIARRGEKRHSPRVFEPSALHPGDVAKVFEVDIHYDSYLQKLGHVPAACRLSFDEEVCIAAWVCLVVWWHRLLCDSRGICGTR